MENKTNIEHYSLEELSIKIGDLRYDALEKFLKLLSDKIYNDSNKNFYDGNPELSKLLREASGGIGKASNIIYNAWEISKSSLILDCSKSKCDTFTNFCKDCNNNHCPESKDKVLIFNKEGILEKFVISIDQALDYVRNKNYIVDDRNIGDKNE